MGGRRPGVRGTRTVRRLLGVATVVALVGPLSNVARPDGAAAAPTGYVTMSDGVSIAVNVRMPTNYVPGLRYPTVFEMSGYDGGSANGGTLAKDVGVPPGTPVPVDDSRQLTDYLDGDYVTVHASVRGTGCSSGEFDLFSWRSALDGKEIIDNWIPNQPWSNGSVGILGHSYGGITGFMVAATQPQHLKAATVSGLIDDLYRGIVYPGGVSNYGFPLIWTGGIRTAYDVGGGLLPGLVRPQRPGDSPNRQEQCALNTAGKSRSVTNDPVLQGLSDTDNDWYRSRSLITYVDKIKVPIHITGAYQDEQTGPRGQTHLFERVGGVPKRLILTNGNHDTESTADYGVPDIRNDRKSSARPLGARRERRVREPQAGALVGQRPVRDAQGDAARRGDADREGGARPERPQGRQDVPAARHRLDGLVPPWQRLRDDCRADRARVVAVVCHGHEAPVLVVSGRRRRRPTGDNGGRAGRVDVPQPSRPDGYRHRGADHVDVVRAEHRARHRAVRGPRRRGA